MIGSIFGTRFFLYGCYSYSFICVWTHLCMHACIMETTVGIHHVVSCISYLIPKLMNLPSLASQLASQLLWYLPPVCWYYRLGLNAHLVFASVMGSEHHSSHLGGKCFALCNIFPVHRTRLVNTENLVGNATVL